MIDVKAVQDQAIKEVTEERTKKAVIALKAKLKQLDDAKQIVTNLERERDDLLASIGDGSFAG